jgi:hypothetical protein
LAIVGLTHIRALTVTRNFFNRLLSLVEGLIPGKTITHPAKPWRR